MFMKDSYNFEYLDDYCCEMRRKDSISSRYGIDEILLLFKMLDGQKYSNIFCDNNTLIMSNSNRIITINNLDKYKKLDLLKCFPNNSIKIEDALNNKKKSRLINKFTLSVAVLSTLIVGGCVLNKEKSHEINNSYKEAIMDDQTEYDPEYELYKALNSKRLIKNNIDETEELVLNTEIPSIDIDYMDRTSSTDFKYVREKYNNEINDVSKKYGVSPNLIRAMVTQESVGIDTNLMQITWDAWEDHVFNVPNFETMTFEKYVLTDDSSKYGDGFNTISRNDLNNPENNIKIGVFIFKELLEDYYNYNIPLAIQAYNYGPGNINNLLEIESSVTGKSVKELIDDKTNVDFINYTNNISQGDPNYLKNVLSYLDDKKIDIKSIDKNHIGNLVITNSIVLNNQKAKTL